jgi:hypothetical protein
MSHGGYSQSITIPNPFYTMYCVPEINFGNNVPPGITEKQQKTVSFGKRKTKKNRAYV